MKVSYYNPLNDTLIERDKPKGAFKIISAKRFDGILEPITYYIDEQLFLITKGKATMFGDREFYLFNKDTIESLVMKDASQRIERSVATRALIGGVIAGDMGFLLGTLSALKDKYRYFKQVVINEKFKISFDQNEFVKIKSFFEELFEELLKKEKKEEIEHKEYIKKYESIEMLKKLKELLDLGIITQEEFEDKKEKLIKMI